MRLILNALFILPCFFATAPSAAAGGATKWEVSSSPMLDTVLFVGVLSGDPLPQEFYAGDVEKFRSKLSEEGRAAVDRIGAVYELEGAGIAGPSLAYYLSALLPASVDEAITALADAKAIAVRANAESAGLSDKHFLIAAPDLRVALLALRDAGFQAYYADEIAPGIMEQKAAFKDKLSAYDIIPEQARLLGRPLDPRIEVIVLHYNMPYGIRIIGQRFIANHDWPWMGVLRVAAHEIFHPPFDLEDETIWDAARPLERSPYMQSLLEKRDPRWGYEGFDGILNEDSTQALDKIVAERMGFAPDLGEHWRNQNGGMHVLAAALFEAMKDTGFADTGGRYQDWLRQALSSGVLSEEEVQRRAAIIIGEEAVAKWAPANDNAQPMKAVSTRED